MWVKQNSWCTGEVGLGGTHETPAYALKSAGRTSWRRLGSMSNRLLMEIEINAERFWEFKAVSTVSNMIVWSLRNEPCDSLFCSHVSWRYQGDRPSLCCLVEPEIRYPASCSWLVLIFCRRILYFSPTLCREFAFWSWDSRSQKGTEGQIFGPPMKTWIHTLVCVLVRLQESPLNCSSVAELSMLRVCFEVVKEIPSFEKLRKLRRIEWTIWLIPCGVKCSGWGFRP